MEDILLNDAIKKDFYFALFLLFPRETIKLIRTDVEAIVYFDVCREICVRYRGFKSCNGNVDNYISSETRRFLQSLIVLPKEAQKARWQLLTKDLLTCNQLLRNLINVTFENPWIEGLKELETLFRLTVDEIRYIGVSELSLSYDEAFISEWKAKTNYSFGEASTETDKNDKATKIVQTFHFNKTEEELMRIFHELVKDGFIKSDYDINKWLYVCGCDVDVSFSPIIWIAKNKRTNQPSKKSLLDFLLLMGANEKEIRLCINDCFKVDGGRTFIAQDYTNYKDWNTDIKSEYHSELEKIVNNI